LNDYNDEELNIGSNIDENETIDENSIPNKQQSQDANETTLDRNLHLTPASVQFPEDSRCTCTIEEIEADCSAIDNALTNQLPGRLPEYKALESPRPFNWGLSSDGRTITVKTSSTDSAYNDISQWHKNTFLVPYGKTGKDFIDQLTKHINNWNNGTEGQHVSLKAAIVLMAVGLQKPYKKSKAKDNQECLAKCLTLWKEGEIDTLLREGKMIQRRLNNSKRTKPPNKAKVFANLVMRGQIHSALQYISDDNGGGILPLSDDVMRQLKEKHPDAQEARLGSLLFGPIEDILDTIFQEIDLLKAPHKGIPSP